MSLLSKTIFCDEECMLQAAAQQANIVVPARTLRDRTNAMDATADQQLMDEGYKATERRSCDAYSWHLFDALIVEKNTFVEIPTSPPPGPKRAVHTEPKQLPSSQSSQLRFQTLASPLNLTLNFEGAVEADGDANSSMGTGLSPQGDGMGFRWPVVGDYPSTPEAPAAIWQPGKMMLSLQKLVPHGDITTPAPASQTEKPAVQVSLEKELKKRTIISIDYELAKQGHAVAATSSTAAVYPVQGGEQVPFTPVRPMSLHDVLDAVSPETQQYQ